MCVHADKHTCTHIAVYIRREPLAYPHMLYEMAELKRGMFLKESCAKIIHLAAVSEIICIFIHCQDNIKVLFFLLHFTMLQDSIFSISQNELPLTYFYLSSIFLGAQEEAV